MISLKNHELDQKLKTLAKQERELLREVLEHIKEAEIRRLYLDYAYPNLFEYLIGCGFSAGSAQRRIDAARLMMIEPKLGNKIEKGEINLGQTSLAQKAIRQKNKTCRVTNEEKKNLLEKLSGKSHHETQVLIAQELDLELKASPKETFQKNESVRLEVTLTKEQWESLEKARALASNATHSNDWAIVLEYLSQKFIRQKEGSTATVAVKKRILQRDQVCQFKDQNTDKICGSDWNLHIDHVQPRWANGGNEIENLRVLCQKHNHHRYRQQTRTKFMN